MPHRALDHLPARVAGCLALCVLTLAGCSDEPSAEGRPASSATGASSSDPPSGSATSSPSDSTSAPSASASASRTTPPSSSSSAGPRTLRSRLLTAEQLPGFNDQFRWAQGPTAAEDPSSSIGTCQRFSITAIGAERAVVRGFHPATSSTGAGPVDRAGELVATFADDLTARRAFAVLEAWRAQCADRLRSHARSDVGRLQDVPVTGGRGRWYLLTYGPVKGDPDAQFFDAQGMVVVGSRIAMVSMRLAGQDYSYEAGREPMVAAVREAARALT
jgi:hypothetical protein